MFGYMTAREALAAGFTHHGSYYGVPCWIGGLDTPPSEWLMVATKWAPMEYVMTFFHHVEGTLRPLLFPDDEPAFQFKVMQPIARAALP